MCKGCAKLRLGRQGEHIDECIKKVDIEILQDTEWANKIGMSYAQRQQGME